MNLPRILRRRLEFQAHASGAQIECDGLEFGATSKSNGDLHLYRFAEGPAAFPIHQRLCGA
jgi:hypothetical protein